MTIDIDLSDLGALATETNKRPAARRRGARHGGTNTQGTKPQIRATIRATKNLPSLLTRDPYDTVGVELHMLRLTCARCGHVHESPLPRESVLRRQVRRGLRTPEERLIGGPAPWIARSTPESVQEHQDWRENHTAAARWIREDRAVELVIHEDWTAACPHCVELVDDRADQGTGTQLSLHLWPLMRRSCAVKPPESRVKPPVEYRQPEVRFHDDENIIPIRRERGQLYKTRFLAALFLASDPREPEADFTR